ncbi:MAG: carboxypeptidase-like regulatory domain-containing protein [Bryobacteraceae bacterium]|nr:carboxypeptidase-like regulatory domain-containing protein [Bryobacteraceae bacterium]
MPATTHVTVWGNPDSHKTPPAIDRHLDCAAALFAGTGVIVTLMFACAAFAQTAQITGRVVDSSSATVANAGVSILNTETGVRRR